MQYSKMQVFSTLEAMLSFEQELPHLNCSCLHCRNNTKPLQRPVAPRVVSPKEKIMNDTKAYEFVVKELTKGYMGKCQVPDVFMLSDASMVFQSRNLGKPRVKEHQTNMEAKKHFQEQRKRGIGYFASQLLSSTISVIPEEPGAATVIGTKSHKQKQAAILTYSDGTQQMLTEVLLSKILDKRKNDPSWEFISHILLIPPEIKHPFIKMKHHYIRSADSIPQLNPYIDKISMQMDGVDQKTFSSGSVKPQKLLFLPLEEEEYMESSSITNPERHSFTSTARKTRSMVIPKKASHYNYEEINQEYVKKISLELVAYIEVTSLMRVLKADLQFFNDGSKVYLSNIYNFVYQILEGTELTMVHDRYRSLEEINLKDIAMVKEEYDKREAQELLNICRATVKECLQFRKVQLKLKDYKNPSVETLLNIFMSIFPDFKVQEIFKSINWKNQLGAFITNSRNKINKIIREDQGIRILRRFGIQFRRTFQ